MSENVIKLASTRREPVSRGCSTCRHAPRNPHVPFARCGATGNYIENERFYNSYACGQEGRLWEAQPPKPPRLGILGTLRLWLLGDK